MYKSFELLGKEGSYKSSLHGESPVSAGDGFLHSLQDKLKVADVYQDNLHKQMSSLEATVFQSKQEVSKKELLPLLKSFCCISVADFWAQSFKADAACAPQ